MQTVHWYMTPDLMLVQNAKSYVLLVSATVLSWLACKCTKYQCFTSIYT